MAQSQLTQSQLAQSGIKTRLLAMVPTVIILAMDVTVIFGVAKTTTVLPATSLSPVITATSEQDRISVAGDEISAKQSRLSGTPEEITAGTPDVSPIRGASISRDSSFFTPGTFIPGAFIPGTDWTPLLRTLSSLAIGKMKRQMKNPRSDDDMTRT